jgi:hypothetical protein
VQVVTADDGRRVFEHVAEVAHMFGRKLIFGGAVRPLSPEPQRKGCGEGQRRLLLARRTYRSEARIAPELWIPAIITERKGLARRKIGGL